MVLAIAGSSQQTYRRLFWLLLGASTIFRLAIANRVGLGVDESHYVLYSRHLAWGYFDHPPMVAFLAALTTIGKNSLFLVRLGPILCSTASLVLLRYLGLALYRDESVVFWALVLLLLMPYQHLLMVALLPDATLNLFWCGALLAVWCGLRDETWFAWMLAGLLFGGALLSKYHGVLLPLCLFCYLITSPRLRFWLGRPQPYVAVLLGFTVFLPNIIWNARRQWLSYRYQLGHGAGWELELNNLLELLGGQLGAWSPLIFILLIVVYVVMIRTKESSEADRFVFWTSLPVFVFFIGFGAIGEILPHWTSIGWWTGSLAAVVVTMRKVSQKDRVGTRWRRWWTAAAILGLLMSTTVHLGVLHPIIGPLYSQARSVTLRLNQHIPAIKPLEPFRANLDITNELFGWEEIAARVEAIRAKMPRPEKTFIFAHRFYTTSQLGVYLQPDTVTTSLHRSFSQYRLWFSPDDYKHWDGLFVDDDRFSRPPEKYLHLFHRVDPDPVKIRVYRNRHYLTREIKVYKYYDFKGQFDQ
jgi:hypothetical protein